MLPSVDVSCTPQLRNSDLVPSQAKEPGALGVCACSVSLGTWDPSHSLTVLGALIDVLSDEQEF